MHVSPGAGNASAFGTLTMSNLQVNGGDFQLDLGSPNAGSFDFINVTNTATFAAASTITPGIGAGAGSYTILTAGTLVGNVLPSITAPAGSGNTRPTTYSDSFVGNSLVLSIAGGAASITWGGQTSNSWDLTGVHNWKLNGADDQFYTADTVTFDDSAGTFNVNVTDSVSPASITVANSIGNNYTIGGTGVITGSTSLTKNGGATTAGALLLSSNNTYTGPTTINAGTLIVAGNGSTSLVTVNGGTLQIGDGTTTGAVSTNIVNNGAVVFNHSGPYTYSNSISGTGALYQSGVGTTTLAASSSYTGPTNIPTSAVVVKVAGALGDVANVSNGTATVSGTATYHSDTNTVSNDVPGGQLDLSGITTTNIAAPFGARTFHISGAGPDGTGVIVNNGVSQQNAFQQIVLDGDAVVGGAQRFDIRGGTPTLNLQSHTLVKIGNGQFSLVGTNVTGGNIVVNAGTFGTEAGITLQDGTNPGDNGTVFFNGNNTVWEIFNVTNPSAVTRPFVINGTGVKVGENSATPSIVSSNIFLHNNVEFTQIGATGGGTFAGNIIEDATPRTITKTGATTITFSGSNTFSGGVNINAGTLQLGSVNALNSSGVNAVAFGNTGTTAAGLKLNGNNLTISGLTTVASNGPTVVEASNGSPILTVNVATTNTYGGQLQDNGGQLNLVKGGTGTLILTGASNNYSGTTTISAGTLQIGAGGTTGSLSGNSTIVGSGTLVFNRSDDAAFGSPINDAVNVIKTGNNTVTLTNTSVTTGSIIVNGGALSVTGSLPATGAITLVSGGTLSGTGSVGHVDVIAGTSIRPGAAPRRRQRRTSHRR